MGMDLTIHHYQSRYIIKKGTQLLCTVGLLLQMARGPVCGTVVSTGPTAAGKVAVGEVCGWFGGRLGQRVGCAWVNLRA